MTTQSKMTKAAKEPTPSAVERAEDLPEFAPATDIYEKPDSILVLCDMPGVDQAGVDITVEDGVLTIMGRQQSAAPEGGEALYRGYETGVFRRSFSLSTEIDGAGIKARIANGVLEIVLPKAERARPRRIEVEAGG